MRISGNVPPSVILSQKGIAIKWNEMPRGSRNSGKYEIKIEKLVTTIKHMQTQKRMGPGDL